jgi:hypothetical protein
MDMDDNLRGNRIVRRRTWAARLLAGSGVALAVLAAVAPVLADETPVDPEAGRPAVYGGEADAIGVAWRADRKAGFLPLADSFTGQPQSVYGELPEGRSRFDSSGISRARASVFYPGAAVAGGAGLACGEVGGAFPEPFATIFGICLQNKDYPLTVVADNDNPDAATPGSASLGKPGQPVSANAGGARAHAGRDFVATDAVLSDLEILGPKGLPAAAAAFRTAAATILGRPALAAADGPSNLVVRVDQVTSRTSQRFSDDNRVLTVTAEARLKGVELAGGAVRIDTIVARTVSRTEGDKPPATEAVATYQGVTVAGQPARIGSDGIVVGPAGSPVAEALNAALGKLLGTTGITVRALGASRETKGIQTSGNAQGLLVGWELDLTGLKLPPDFPVANPADVYFASVTLGSAGGAAFADLSGLDLGEGTASPGDGTFGGPLDGGMPFEEAGPTGTGIPGTDLTGPALSPAAGTTRPGPARRSAGGPTEAAAATFRPAGLLGGVVANRVKVLYLSFTLSALGVAVAPRLARRALLPPRT